MNLKICVFLCLFVCIVKFVGAQEITGQWNGQIKLQGIQLRVVFNITKTGDAYSSTMTSPDQSPKPVQFTKTIFENNILTLEMPSYKIKYICEWKDNKLVGDFEQSGHKFPLELSRELIEKEQIKRPQEPKKPYPYRSEDITFENKEAKVILAGTLTMPNVGNNFPVVVLITGSGPQNRDEEILGHKPFLFIADYLTKNGIAVLRYDDRGTGKSTGDFKTSTSADFEKDAQAAVDYLHTRAEINKQKIGLMGHSEGGEIAPMLASKNKEIKFIVLLAGPGISGSKLMLLQEEKIAKASGSSESEIQKTRQINSGVFDIVMKESDMEKMKIQIKEYLNTVKNFPEGTNADEYGKLIIQQVATQWMKYFLALDPSQFLQKVKCPVLAVNGAKDLQVPSKENLKAIQAVLEKNGNKKVTVKEYPNLNHLFQECKTGLPDEYATIEQTFSEDVMHDVLAWINGVVK